VRKVPSGVDIHSAGQEIPFFLLKANVHDHVHKSPYMAPILNQLNPGHTLTSYF
jgi:hypothetical protein